MKTNAQFERKTQFSFLEFNENYEQHESDETCYSDSFFLIHQIDVNHKSSSICWVSGVLLFTEVCNLKRLVSDIILPISANTKPITIIGYSSKENCVCVCVFCADSKKKKKKLIRLFFPFVTF